MTLTRKRRSDKCRRDHVTRRNAFVIAMALVIPMLVAPPLGAESTHTNSSTPAPLFGVGLARCTFVDHSRSALNYSTTPPRALPGGRRLVTEIRYPIRLLPGQPAETAGTPPLPQAGGYPMVVFAHGYAVTPDTYAALLDAWTRQGFVVVAPFFPDESAAGVAAQHGANTENDLINEPGDLTFVTQSILAASADEATNCHIVSGLVDPSEIALAGHSDGAEVVGMLAYDHGVDPQGVNYASLRAGIAFRAVIILSGAEDTYQSYATEASRPNLMVVQSLDDHCNLMFRGVQLYNSIHQSNKWFLELQTAHHLPPFDGVDTLAFGVVVTTTDRFLQMTLEKIAFPVTFLTLGNERPAIARMFMGSNGPSMKTVKRVTQFCGPN